MFILCFVIQYYHLKFFGSNCPGFCHGILLPMWFLFLFDLPPPFFHSLFPGIMKCFRFILCFKSYKTNKEKR